MVNLKTYKDGDRLIMVVENCKGETARKVSRLIAELMDVCGGEDFADAETAVTEATVQTEITDLEPVEVPEEDVPEVTPEQEVQLEDAAPQEKKGYRIGNMETAIQLLLNESEDPEGAATAAYWISKSGKEYLTPLMRSYRQSELVKKDVHRLFDAYGYGTAEDFLAEASDEVKKQFGEAILNALWKRCRK